jgi:hypothetical protein
MMRGGVGRLPLSVRMGPLAADGGRELGMVARGRTTAAKAFHMHSRFWWSLIDCVYGLDVCDVST